MRIIIVEDEVKIRTAMGRLIEDVTGHKVIGEAKSGKEGLELFFKYRPDLIITDIRMPEMDGLEMLKALHEKGIPFHAVILSGYAEFDYARQAMALGVNDYLLKPVSVEDVKELLERLDQKLTEEDRSHTGLSGTLLDIYMGRAEKGEAALQKLKLLPEQDKPEFYQLYIGYIGAAPALYEKQFKTVMDRLSQSFEDIRFTMACADKQQELLILAAGMRDLSPVTARFNSWILEPYKKQKEQAAWAMAEFEDIFNLPAKIEEVHDSLALSLVLGGERLLTKEFSDEFLPESFVYPVKLEQNLKTLLCSGKTAGVGKCLREFSAYMKEHLFSPQDVRYGYMKLFTYIINLFQEIDTGVYRRLQNLYLLKQTAEVRVPQELEGLLENVLEILESGGEKREDIGNYTIKRAINFIREHYQEGISLEAAADSLEITPEYLSTLFNKEMEVNFSVFLKNFRISHAKRLLKGTDLRIYEVAQAVGYHDSKYFIRVFKEVTGISPGEFRSRS